MLNVCPHCGHYQADKEIIEPGVCRCDHCRQTIAFTQAPLFVVGGPSAAGKSTLCQLASGQLDSVVVLDMDILWYDVFNEPESSYRTFFETWLRMAKNISASGRPVVLFGAGACVPENIEPCVERRYFSKVHYLAISCDDAIIRERLLARPEWRGCGDDAFIAQQLVFNQQLKDRASEPGSFSFQCLDTSHNSPQETLQQFKSWLAAKMA